MRYFIFLYKYSNKWSRTAYIWGIQALQKVYKKSKMHYLIKRKVWHCLVLSLYGIASKVELHQIIENERQCHILLLTKSQQIFEECLNLSRNIAKALMFCGSSLSSKIVVSQCVTSFFKKSSKIKIYVNTKAVMTLPYLVK